jgi:hypothetical protein
MLDINVYNELAIDLLTTCSLNKMQADKIVSFLKENELIDYDVLKEFYAELFNS